MGVSVHFNDTLYLSSKEAGRVSGYTSDYIARLARQGKVEATRVGTQWFVEPKSLEQFLQFAELSKEDRKNKLRTERRAERVMPVTSSAATHVVAKVVVPFVANSSYNRSTLTTHAAALTVVCVGFFAAVLFTQTLRLEGFTVASVAHEARITAYGFYQLTTSSSDSSGSSMLSAVGATSVGSVDVVHTVSDQRLATVNGGLVILPQNVASATIKYIQESFSDEVHVALDENGSTGIVTPVFSDGTGDPYRFIIVPLTSTPP